MVGMDDTNDTDAGGVCRCRRCGTPGLPNLTEAERRRRSGPWPYGTKRLIAVPKSVWPKRCVPCLGVHDGEEGRLREAEKAICMGPTEGARVIWPAAVPLTWEVVEAIDRVADHGLARGRLTTRVQWHEDRRKEQRGKKGCRDSLNQESRRRGTRGRSSAIDNAVSV